jgi:hypothetical protein
MVEEGFGWPTLAQRAPGAGGSRPFSFDIVLDGEVHRLVPNQAEQAVIDRMKAMREAGATLRAIGAEVGLPYKSGARILERSSR